MLVNNSLVFRVSAIFSSTNFIPITLLAHLKMVQFRYIPNTFKFLLSFLFLSLFCFRVFLTLCDSYVWARMKWLRLALFFLTRSPVFYLLCWCATVDYAHVSWGVPVQHCVCYFVVPTSLPSPLPLFQSSSTTQSYVYHNPACGVHGHCRYLIYDLQRSSVRSVSLRIRYLWMECPLTV